MIRIEIYNLFLKYGSECLWSSDPRVKRPKGTSETTDEMFSVLETINNNLEMISSELYSKEMELQFQQEIEKLKPNVSKEVLSLMESNYKTGS
ncbi:hypothetical protein [Lacinutrix salivirga]